MARKLDKQKKGVVKLSTVMASAGITGKIINDLYGRKPTIGKNGEMIFGKAKALRFFGAFCTIIAVLNLFFLGSILEEVIIEYNIESSMVTLVYWGGYALVSLLALYGISTLIIFYTNKIVVTKDSITSLKLFSTKTIKLYAVESVKFSNKKNFTFSDGNTKVEFGRFTTGLLEMLKFIEKNVPQYKCEDAVAKAKKILKNYNYIPKDYGQATM